MSINGKIDWEAHDYSIIRDMFRSLESDLGYMCASARPGEVKKVKLCVYWEGLAECLTASARAVRYIEDFHAKLWFFFSTKPAFTFRERILGQFSSIYQSFDVFQMINGFFFGER